MRVVKLFEEFVNEGAAPKALHELVKKIKLGKRVLTDFAYQNRGGKADRMKPGDEHYDDSAKGNWDSKTREVRNTFKDTLTRLYSDYNIRPNSSDTLFFIDLSDQVAIFFSYDSMFGKAEFGVMDIGRKAGGKYMMPNFKFKTQTIEEMVENLENIYEANKDLFDEITNFSKN